MEELKAPEGGFTTTLKYTGALNDSRSNSANEYFHDDK